MPADRCACRKVALKGDVEAVVTADHREHQRDWCGPDLAAEFVEAVTDLIGTAREDGALIAEDGRPFHPPGCRCGLCLALLTLVRAENGGRCVVCGCTEDDDCGGGCKWTNEARVCCDVHDVTTILAAEKLFAGDKRRKAS